MSVSVSVCTTKESRVDATDGMLMRRDICTLKYKKAQKRGTEGGVGFFI